MLTNVTKNSILDLAGILDTILYYITRNLAIHVYFLLFFFLDDSLFSSSSIFVTSHPGKGSTPRIEPLSSVNFSQFSAKRGNKNGSVCSSSDARDLRFSINFWKWLSILKNLTGSFQGGRSTACVCFISDTTVSKTSITPHQLIKKSWPRTWNIKTCIVNITIRFYTSFTLHANINIITQQQHL